MSRREALVAAAIYVLLAVVFVSPALLPGRTLASADYLWTQAPWHASTPAGVRSLGSNPELVDPATVFAPLVQYEADTFPHPPLWNPYVMGGRPLLADGQSAPYSVYTLPAYALPFWRSLAVTALLKLFVAAFGTFLFARLALGMRFAGGLFAGIVFAFGLFMVAWLPWPLTSVWSFLPWLLLLTDRIVRAPSRLAVAGLAAVVGLQYLGGHPESSFQVLAVTAAFALMRIVQRWRAEGRDAALKGAASALAALALGTALAALVLLPTGELVLRSADLAQRSHEPYAVTPAKYLLAVLLPDYWGLPTQTELSGFLIQRAFYAGALTLLLAAVALAARRSAERLFMAGLGLISLAVVVGLQPITFLVRLIPGFSIAHNTRLVIFYLLAVALLAGWGLDELTTRGPLRGVRGAKRARPDRVLRAAWAAVLVLPLAVVAVRGEFVPRLAGHALRVAAGISRMPPGNSPDAPNVIRMASLIEWIVLAGAATVLVALRVRGRLAATTFVALAALLVCADLFRAGMGENPAIPISHAVQPATGAIRYLQSRRPARFVGVSSPSGSIPLTPDTAVRYRLYDARGYDLPVEKHYDRLWRATVSNATLLIPPTQLAPVNPTSLRTFDLLGVSDLIQAPSDPPLHVPGLRLAYSGSDARVYSNPGAMPRAAVVDAVKVVGSDSAALTAVTDPAFDPARSAIAERPLPGLSRGSSPGAAGLPPPAPAGAAEISSYAPQRVVVRARAARPSLLVLDDLAYPGWQATVDGRPVPVERVDYLLRGVPIWPGAHTIEMRYAPSSWRIGWIVSALALVLLVGLAASGLVARRSR